MNNEDLSTFLAREIFKSGDEYESPCTRIEFKGGDWYKNAEVSQGGMGEEPLARFIFGVLEKAKNT